jgi:hypothetical protein
MTATTSARPASRFGYTAYASESFDDLLDAATQAAAGADAQHARTPQQVVEAALRGGLILLQARAGAGKSRFLQRLRETAQADGVTVVSVDLGAVREVPTDPDQAARQMLEHAGTRLAALSGQPVLILLDGLNEAPGGSAPVVLEAAERLASRYPDTGVVVTDRLTRRRGVGSDRWRLLGLTAVPDGDIASWLGRDPTEIERTLLGTPFYLDRTDPSRPTSGRSGFLRELLTRALPEADLDALARAALRSYHGGRRLLLSKEDLGEVSGGAVEAARAAGVLLDAGEGRLRLRHQLEHDYLAARAVAGEPTAWGDVLFDALSLHAASPDPLVLLAEQVAPSDLDRLVRLVYDWNPYIAAYLLAEDRFAPAPRVRPATSAAIAALLAERRFDPFFFTVQRSADALRALAGDDARRYLRCRALGDVHAAAEAALPNDSGYRQWLSLFRTADVGEAMAALTEADGLRGWTAANVLRRLGGGNSSVVQELARGGSRVVRWRAVHVLGVLPATSLATLLTCLDDPSPDAVNVRYGALRSIVENAARLPEPAQRAAVLAELTSRADSLRASRPLSSELERTLVLVSPPRDWLSTCAPLLDRLVEGAADALEQTRWSRLVADVRAAGEAEPGESAATGTAPPRAGPPVPGLS